ncbi:hypothetical protein GCM10010441_11510 [Kitasatospora paracochleata]|uniref:Uncharacterized protein n=1 Tax=Kitasatospora paracochleata TaxID=58354 RepID=A0ABT1JA31_9ACTN|nr:hypothetical protein [Kitasatospora paracochleata]MCP2314315.1 hypothetical protein [Kitasatospora paracochleata]
MRRSEQGEDLAIGRWEKVGGPVVLAGDLQQRLAGDLQALADPLGPGQLVDEVGNLFAEPVRLPPERERPNWSDSRGRSQALSLIL